MNAVCSIKKTLWIELYCLSRNFRFMQIWRTVSTFKLQKQFNAEEPILTKA